MNSVQDAMGVVDTASGCSDHPVTLGFTEADIEKVLYYDAGCHCGSVSKGGMCNDYCDTWSTAVFRLKNGKYVYANESSDTSGHG